MKKISQRKNRTVLLILPLAMSLLPSVGRAEKITFASLLEEMTDRGQVAQWPSPAYTCKQFSSYDRHSVEPGGPGWWANMDRSYFLRVEENQGRKEYVMMDTDGPGAVVRFWATWHGPKGQPFSNGPVRVYLDYNPVPTMEAPISDFLDKGYLVNAPLSQGVAQQSPYERQGHNLYLPIPYAKHCKITYETGSFIEDGAHKSEALYYQINYRTYEKKTSVRTFSMTDLKKNAGLIEKTQQLLIDGNKTIKGTQLPLTGELKAGDVLSADLKGTQAIGSLTVRLEAADLPQALRSVVLQMEFDGRKTVWCPAGDFFGIGYQVHPYATWYTQVLEDGTMSCVWTMPFKNQARVSLENLGAQTVNVTGQLTTVSWKWNKRSMYFHAAWKQFPDFETQSNPADPEKGASDLNWVTIKGRGKYVGDALALYNNAPSHWWGEGDEKIYVDSESFPSHFGTGSEDYYSYAWCMPAPFSAPFHAQPWGEGNTKTGFSANCRFRSLDAIPFETSLKFDMELWHWAKTQMDYAPTTFWYAVAGDSWDVQPMPDQALRKVQTKPKAQ
jgi:hypothetical protein